MNQRKGARKWVITGIAGAVVASLGGAFGCPHYNVWQQGMAGQARLEEAKQSRQIAVEAARARKESAVHDAAAKLTIANGDAAAEHARAKGMALAIEEVGAKLKEQGPEYIHWRWVEGLHDGSSEVIYIPTEAGMPILEARPRK